MTLLVEKGTFVKVSSAVAGTDQTVNLANSSLTPKVLWLWTSGNTSANAYGEGYQVSYGFSDGTNDACVFSVSEDNSSSTDYAAGIRNDSVIAIQSTSTPATIAAQGNVLSFNAGNFVLDWAVSSNNADIIHYMVLGGTDITNVLVKQVGAPTADGNRAETGVGFQGDFLQTIFAGVASSGMTVNTTNVNAVTSIGAATSSSARWVFGASCEHNAGTSDTYNTKEITRCVLGWQTSDAAINQKFAADFLNWGSDGFTLNWSNTAIFNCPVAYLIIKGGLWDVGNGTAPSTATTQNVSVTANRNVKGVMLGTWGDTTTASGANGEAQARISMGGCDASLNQGGIAIHDLDAQATAEITSKYSSNTKILRAHTATATATSSTLLAEANVSSVSTTGQFTLNWTTTLNAMGYVWFAVSEGESTTPVSETSIHKYNMLANATQTSIHKYNMIGNVLRAHIHKYDILNVVPPQTSIHKYDLRQNIAQTSIHKYNLFANIVQTSIHKYNLIQNILQASIHKYHLLNTIAQTNIHKYNLLNNVLRTSIHKYNLLQNIVQTSIHKYSLFANIVQTSIHKYNLAAFIAQQSIQKYSILAYVLQNSIHKYNLEALGAVSNALIAKYDILANVLQTNIHKYSLLQYIAQTSIHKYNLLAYIAQSSIHKYSLLANVLQSSIHKYGILANVLQNSIHKYNVLANILQTSLHKYNILANVLQSSIHKYDLQVLGAVVNALIAKYDIFAYATQTNKHKYDLLNNILQSSIHKYNLLVNILTSSKQKYNILQSIVNTSIHKYALLQNVILSSIHKYDIIAEAATVLVNSIHKYHLLNTIAQTSKHKYDILNTVAQSSIHKYNLLQQILRTSIHKYNMGGVLVVQSRHVYNIVREIFGSSVAGGVAKKRVLKTIKYPVYHVSELERLERRKRLRDTQAVIIPAFTEQINRTVAPFVVTNPITNRVTVRFAVVRKEPITFAAKVPLPLQITGKTVKKEAQKAKSAHVMQQKAIERYGKRLNKLSKIMTLFFLAKQLPDDK